MANRGSFKKGEKRPYQGRPKGAIGKATREFRETVRMLLEENADNVKAWLAEVASQDPGKALDILGRLAEYASPKLGRTEVTGKDGKDLPDSVVINVIGRKPK